jgi:hypothetical protein
VQGSHHGPTTPEKSKVHKAERFAAFANDVLRKEATVARKRGAQPGNTNALKHGFYAKHQRSGEVLDLAGVEGLQDEIGMYRILLRRLFEYADQPEMTLEGWMDILESAGLGFTRLSGLIRVQKLLGSGGGDMAEALSEALKEVTSKYKSG